MRENIDIVIFSIILAALVAVVFCLAAEEVRECDARHCDNGTPSVILNQGCVCIAGRPQ